MDVHSAGVIRTARLLFTGMLRVPREAGVEGWDEPEEYREMHNQFCQLFRPGDQDMTKSPRALSRAVVQA